MRMNEAAVGETFGRLTGVKPVGSYHVICRCKCGTEKRFNVYLLIKGHTRSCGCLQRELTAKRSITHGKSGTREFRLWQAMLTRGRNKKIANAKHYSLRGITVCDDWTGPNGFELFMAHIGPCPSDRHSVDRIDNDKGYYPGNVRWATQS